MRLAIPLGLADRIHVDNRKLLALSAGGRVRITKNGKSIVGKRLDNGTMATVLAFTNDGVSNWLAVPFSLPTFNISPTAMR